MHKALLPRPRFLKRTPGCLVFDGSFSVSVAGQKPWKTRNFKQLTQRLEEITMNHGYTFHIFREFNQWPAALDRWPPSHATGIIEHGDEEYELTIRSTYISIYASGRAGAFYALQTLKQLKRRSGTRLIFPCLTIRDWPAFESRGLLADFNSHFGAPDNPTRVDYIRSIIDRMSQYKLNVLYYYSDWTSLQLETAPELTPGTALTKNQLRELILYGQARCVEIVPTFNCFGHWSQAMAKCHADLSEEGRGTNFDPSNTAVYSFLDRIINEVCTLFPSRWFHGGCDEVTTLGLCPSCRKLGMDESWLRHINHLSAIVKRYGKRLIIYSDYLDRKIKSHPAKLKLLDRLDLDVVLDYWKYADCGHPGLLAMVNRSPSFARKPRGLPRGGMAFLASEGSAKMPRALARGASQKHDFQILSAASTLHKIFPTNSNLDNIEGLISLVNRAPVLRRNIRRVNTAVWLNAGRWFEPAWPGVCRHADLAWYGTVDSRHAFFTRFSFNFLGMKDSIGPAIMELSNCNVFDKAGGDRATLTNLFVDLEKAAGDRFTKEELLRRIAKIPARIRRVRQILRAYDSQVIRNRFFFSNLELAADRFDFFAQRILLLEQACAHYRQAVIRRYASGWGQRVRPPDPKGLIMHLRGAVCCLKAIRIIVLPLWRRIQNIWLACQLPGTTLDRYQRQRFSDYRRDLTSLINELEMLIEHYDPDAYPSKIPQADRMFIFKSDKQRIQKQYCPF